MTPTRSLVIVALATMFAACAAYPRLSRPPLEPPADAQWLDGGQGLRLFASVVVPEQATGTVWFVQGPEGGSTPLYPRFTEGLHRAGFATAVFHPRGTGWSDGVRGDADDPEALEIDQHRFLDELTRLAPGPVFLFGHSAGAAYALDVTRHASRAIAGVVLVNPAYRFKQSEGMTPTAGQVVQFAVNLVFRPAAITVDMNSNPSIISFPPDREEGLALQRDPVVVRFFSMRFMTAEQRVLRDSKEAIETLEAPLLVVEGAHDGLIDPAGTDELFRLAKSKDKARLVALDGGHGSSAVETMSEPVVDWLISRRDAAATIKEP